MLVKFKNNGFKGNLVKAYNYYCLVNNIVWDRPKYKWEQNKPKIPTEESLNKIIASWGWKYTRALNSKLGPFKHRRCHMANLESLKKH